MGFHCIAAKLLRVGWAVGVEEWVIAADCHIAICPAKSYHGSAYPRSGFRSMLVNTACH